MAKMFDSGDAVRNIIIRESKAVDEYLSGNKKAYNYLFGKVSSQQWGDLVLDNGNPITIDDKMEPEYIRRYIENTIKIVRGLPF